MTSKRKVALVATGGTIDKIYDEYEGVLHNRYGVLDMMLASLRLEGVELSRTELMHKDSLDLTAEDHQLIAETARQLATDHDAVVIVHGTDRLANTGEWIVEHIETPRVPIILTGAMRPYIMRNTDAAQNLTEALLAAQMLSPGVYCVMHNQVLPFPGVVKDPERGTFVRE